MITNVIPRPSDPRIRQEPVPAKHLLPPLPYEYAALEPHIGARTMMLHHDKHHASYVEKLNAALEGFPELQGRTAIWLLLNLIKVPKEIRTDVRNNAGGHVNHSLFWRAMSRTGGGTPAGPLADAIVIDFGSVERQKTRFAEVGQELLSSLRPFAATMERPSPEPRGLMQWSSRARDRFAALPVPAGFPNSPFAGRRVSRLRSPAPPEG